MQTINMAKRKGTQSIKVEIKEKWKHKVEKLAMQGDFVQLLEE